jgi:hypothetical protein
MMPGMEGSTDPMRPTPEELTLPELIRGQMAALSLSYDQVEQRAQRAGYQVSDSTVYNLVTRPMRRAPSKEILEGLAAGLDLPLVRLQRATLRALGWDLTQILDDDEETLIVYRRQLPRDQRRLVDEMVRSMRRLRRERDRNSA